MKRAIVLVSAFGTLVAGSIIVSYNLPGADPADPVDAALDAGVGVLLRDDAECTAGMVLSAAGVCEVVE